MGPGSAKTRTTGTWSHYKTVVDQTKCIQCLECMFHCPEGAISRDGDKVKITKMYCKACRICEKVCPTDAIYVIKINGFSEITS
ncbi:MAG: 4Fe-4S binding protein [Candidatus Heimdallarchaeaceae archaeon]